MFWVLVNCFIVSTKTSGNINCIFKYYARFNTAAAQPITALNLRKTSTSNVRTPSSPVPFAEN